MVPKVDFSVQTKCSLVADLCHSQLDTYTLNSRSQFWIQFRVSFQFIIFHFRFGFVNVSFMYSFSATFALVFVNENHTALSALPFHNPVSATAYTRLSN